MNYLDHHHHLKEARPWHRHTRAEDELSWSYRYLLKCAEIRTLKEVAERRKILDDMAARSNNIVNVRTCGQCLPASGVMLWKGGGYSLVWFEGADAPMVWPCANLEVSE